MRRLIFTEPHKEVMSYQELCEILLKTTKVNKTFYKDSVQESETPFVAIKMFNGDWGVLLQTQFRQDEWVIANYQSLPLSNSHSSESSLKELLCRFKENQIFVFDSLKEMVNYIESN